MSKRRGGHGGGHENHERWLLTYADMITLLLALFIVMFAMSSTDAKKYAQLAQSLSSAFNVTNSGGNSGVMNSSDSVLETAGSAPILPGGNPEYKELKDMMTQLRDNIARENGADANNGISMAINERGLVVSLANSSFFDPGEATLRPGAKNALRTIAGTLSFANHPIMVEGHTDNAPISTARYPSNWELSTARATSVVRTLITDFHLSPKRLSASGYGEYYPVAPNDTPDHRAKNRRVDIVILRSELSGQRPGGGH